MSLNEELRDTTRSSLWNSANVSASVAHANLSENGDGAHDDKPNVADARFDVELRIATLWVEIVIGAIGGLCVFMWLWHNRRRKSRVNALIFHLALSDMLVIIFACGMQLIWEYDRTWGAHEVACRMLKFSQSFAIMASTNMVLVLSIDRHQAIRSPLREPIKVLTMTIIGWGIAFVFSTPQLFIFHVNLVNETKSPWHNKSICESIFRDSDRWTRQAWLTFIGVIIFYIPTLILIICYVRIFLKIAEKANESSSSCRQARKPGKVHLQSTPSSSLPKAKIKTLKMAVLIVLAFVVCAAPYHIVEMIFSYGDHSSVPSTVFAILGALPVANSAVNPYVFMLFNASATCARSLFASLCPCCYRAAENRNFFDSTGGSTRTEYMTSGAGAGHVTAKYSVISSSVQLSNKAGSGGRGTGKTTSFTLEDSRSRRAKQDGQATKPENGPN